MKKYSKIIKNEQNDIERAYYASSDVEFINVLIDGPTDGESAFKESSDIKISKSSLNLRYPCWHNNNLYLDKVKMATTCRAPFWYDNRITFNHVECLGVKAIRECSNVKVINSKIISEEPFWRSKNINVKKSYIEGFYAFFECKNVKISNVEFVGKYSFQYIKKLHIKSANLKTKDAFWHTKDAIIEDTIIEGEYLGWYSENVTFIRCHIKGTQPLCYCKNLTLIDCTFDSSADLAFEYSEVNGNVIGDITSIKNPLTGSLKISGKYNFISDENDRSNGSFKFIKN